MSSSNPVPRLYRTVVDDVIKDVREAFLNEGVDEQVLQELKQLWESKLLQSRAIDYIPADASVRFTVSYPHNHQLQQATQRQPVPQQQQQQQQQPQQVIQQQTSTIQQQAHQQQPVTLQSVAPALQELSQIVQNPQTGQVMYVNHPTLGDVGQMSLPATQAALAIQGATQRDTSGVTASTSHPLQGITVSNTSQLPQIQQLASNAQGSQTIYANYPQGAASAGRGPRVIYTQPTQNPRAHAPVKVIQVDGTNDSSSDDDADDDDDDDYSKFDEYPIGSNKNDNEEEALEEDDPLNSGDDVSDDDPTELFDTDNVVVCQYDKIARSKNKWKFHLKDGIMNLTRKDFVFHKAVGESEW